MKIFYKHNTRPWMEPALPVRGVHGSQQYSQNNEATAREPVATGGILRPSRHFASCHVMSVISRHATSCHVISRNVMPRHVTSCQIMSHHVTSCSRHVKSRHVTSRPVTSCHVMSCHVMSCHVTSCRVMPRYVT